MLLLSYILFLVTVLFLFLVDFFFYLASYSEIPILIYFSFQDHKYKKEINTDEIQKLIIKIKY